MDNARRAWLLSGVRTLAVVFVAVLAVACLVLGGGPAAASEPEPDARTRALRLLERAEADDDALELRKALGEYEEALRIDPSMAKAIRAEARAKALRARAEGDFVPLAALERVRRDPALSSDPAAVDALVQAAEGFPPGLVRLEVWVLAAEAYARRLGRPDDAIRLWRRIVQDPATGADPVLARSAVGSLVALHLARGDLASAEADAASARIGGAPDAAAVATVQRALRRRAVHLGSIVTIAAALLFAALAIGRAARAGRSADVLAHARRSARLVAGYAAYVAIAGGALASGYEDGNARPFLLFGAVLAPLLFVARAWAAAGSASRSARAGRAALCAMSALGAAFLVVEHVDVTYVEGLGL